jgi:hypothetical protein
VVSCASEIADHVFACREDGVFLDLLVAAHEDLRAQHLEARVRDDEMNVCRPIGRPFRCAQELTAWTVRRDRIRGRHERDQLEFAIVVRPVAAAQVVIGLLFVLVFIEAMLAACQVSRTASLIGAFVSKSKTLPVIRTRVPGVSLLAADSPFLRNGEPARKNG